MKKRSCVKFAVGMACNLIAALLLPLLQLGGAPAQVSALSTDYPAQLMNIAVKDNSAVLTEKGTLDGAAITAQSLGNDLSLSWRFDRVGSDSNGTFFKICNAQSGRLLTPQGYSVTEGANVVIYGSESAKSQHWYVVPVSQDRLKNNLYYKIVNYSDTSLALTRGTNGMTLSKYTGADNQLFLLNADGLQGFAGYCANDNTGSTKAGDIGGLFGETVEVTTFDDLKKYATSDDPYTIVVTKNITVTELNLNGERYMCSAGRIYVHGNKTIIGSYNAHTLFNVQFCTSSNSGTGNNIIIKNFDMQHDAESNNNDSIVCYFGSGENIWVDHVTFTGHDNYGYAPKTGKVDEDKFLACCYDADYCTVSDCSFGAHKYGLILGYPADGADLQSKYGGYPRMSLIGNKFNNTNTRGPGLMRWGYFHSLNNYVNQFSMAYTVISDCHIFAENCTYENGGNVICDWDSVAIAGQYAESGSSFSGCNRTKQGGDSNSTALACSWRPTTNYSYISLSAAEAKTYCSTYSGCRSASSDMMYLRFAAKGVPSASYTEAPSAPPRSAYETIEAEDYDSESGTRNEEGTGETHVAYIEDGDSITFANVDFEDGARTFSATAAGNAAQLVLYLDGANTPAATVDFAGTNGWSDWQTISAAIPTISGRHSLTIVFKGGEGYLLNLDQFIFSKQISGRLIEKVSFGALPNAAVCGLADGANVGSAFFGDRDFTYTQYPEALAGAEQIITSCTDKGETAELVSFTAKTDISVFIGLDARMEAVPAFMSGYTKTALSAVSSNDVVFEFWQLDVSAGETVTLSGNGQSYNVVSYTVLITEQQKQEVAGDVNADGKCDILDAILLQKWLVAAPGTVLADWNAGDLNGDGVLTAVDLTMMKQILLKK